MAIKSKGLRVHRGIMPVTKVKTGPRLTSKEGSTSSQELQMSIVRPMQVMDGMFKGLQLEAN